MNVTSTEKEAVGVSRWISRRVPDVWSEPDNHILNWNIEKDEESECCHDVKVETLDVVDRIQRETSKYKTILSYEPNWDGEGAPAYEATTWDRAIDFLIKQATWLSDNHNFLMPIPKILPGPNGTLDLHWENKQFEMLINMHRDTGSLASFYGDDYGSIKIKGTFNPEEVQDMMMLWLRKRAST